MSKRQASATATTSAEEVEWKVQSDLRTLIDAQKIRTDPKRLAAVKALARQQLSTIAPLAGDNEDDAA